MINSQATIQYLKMVFREVSSNPWLLTHIIHRLQLSGFQLAHTMGTAAVSVFADIVFALHKEWYSPKGLVKIHSICSEPNSQGQLLRLMMLSQLLVMGCHRALFLVHYYLHINHSISRNQYINIHFLADIAVIFLGTDLNQTRYPNDISHMKHLLTLTLIVYQSDDTGLEKWAQLYWYAEIMWYLCTCSVPWLGFLTSCRESKPQRINDVC